MAEWFWGTLLWASWMLRLPMVWRLWFESRWSEAYWVKHPVLVRADPVALELQALLQDLPSAPKVGDKVDLDAAFDRLLAP